MPANLIPLVTNSGRIFTSNKVTPESDGLVGIIDMTERNKNHLPCEAIFNATGDSLLVGDSRNQVTLLQIANNRFNVVSANLKELPSIICFTSKHQPQDQVVIVLKDQKKLQVHSLNGKLLESIQSNLHHQLEIKSAVVCPQVGLLLTLSNDACVLWSTNSNSTIRKERSLFAQQGCHFNDARFSPDGRQLATLFRDGNLVLWELDGISGQPNHQQEGQISKFRFPSPQVKLFDIGLNHLVIGSGPSFPYLCIKQLYIDANNQSLNVETQQYKMYKLPNEARGVEQISFLTDKLLLGYLSEGIFYLVDLGQMLQQAAGPCPKLQIALEIRLPGALIKRFSVDHPMNALALTATNGNVFLYNLPVAIQNEQNLIKKRRQMGITELDVLYTYLVAVDPMSVQEDLQSTNGTFIAVDDQSSVSSIAGEQQQQDAAYQNPFLTVGQEGTGLLSQRNQVKSPLMNTLERNQIFNATGSIPHGTLNSRQPLVAVQDPIMIREEGSVAPSNNLSHHFMSQQQMPMPLTAQQHETMSYNAYQMDLQQQQPGGNTFSPIGAQNQQLQFQTSQPPNIAQLSLETRQMQPNEIPNIHNISQSTVAGPYLQQYGGNKAPPQYVSSQRNGGGGCGNPQPIVQLTVPGADRTQVTTRSYRTATTREDYLQQGMPTALMNKGAQGPSTMMSGRNSSNLTAVHGQQNFDHSIDMNYAPEFKETDSVAVSQSAATTAMFNMPKLRRLLKQYGQFPDKYRALTWKYLLRLPLNKEAFQGLLSRGVHPAFKDLHKRFPVSSYRLYNKLVRIMSALGHWSPIFLDVSFMPQIVFPFLKVIPNDDLFVFELIMSLVVQWMQVWFESYPAEPHSICLAVEQIVSSEDGRLAQHLRNMSFHPQQYGWPLMTSFFTEVLSKEDWLKMIDHMFLRNNEPELLLYFLCAYLICSKAQLMQVNCVEDLAVFLNSQTAIPFKKIMTLAESLHSKLKTSSIFPGSFGQNLPVSNQTDSESSSCYQSFTRYPDHFVSFQNRLREKIVNQEEEIQRKNEILVDLKGKANDILEQEERCRLQQEAMARAEADRKTQVRTEMETLLQERIRLDELQRKARLEHVQAIETSIKTSLTQQESLKNEQHKQVQEEVGMIARQQKYEFESRMQDEMIANLEFKANQKLLEQLQKQQQEEHGRQTREKLDTLHQEVLHRQRESMRRWEDQRTETRRQNQMLAHQLKVQQEELTSQRENHYIKEQFGKVKDEQAEMDRQITAERETREADRMIAEQIFRQREESNRQLTVEREEEQRKQEAELEKVRAEYAELDRLKEKEAQDRLRLAQAEQQRQDEIEKTRQMRIQETAQDQMRITEERRRIEDEKAQVARSRDILHQQEQKEIEGRDIMNLVRTTAENVRGIVIDGQKQLEQDREVRQSQQSQNSIIQQHDAPQSSQQQMQQQPSWVMAHPKYSQQQAAQAAPPQNNNQFLENREQPASVSNYMQQVIQAKERLQREQNESLREQLSLQYSQRLRNEKENSNAIHNKSLQDQSTISQEQQNKLAMRYGGGGGGQQVAAYVDQSSTSDSHFSDDSSDVESYHQSKFKYYPADQQYEGQPMATTVGHPQQYQQNQGIAAPNHQALPYTQNPHMIQTHLMPMNHQQLNSMMPNSKSSIGEDISSSFVSSATETTIDNGEEKNAYAGSHMSDSMLTSNDSYIMQQQTQAQEKQKNINQGGGYTGNTMSYQEQQLLMEQALMNPIQQHPAGLQEGQHVSAYGSNQNLIRQHEALTASLSESQSSALTSSLHASGI